MRGGASPQNYQFPAREESSLSAVDPLAAPPCKSALSPIMSL